MFNPNSTSLTVVSFRKEIEIRKQEDAIDSLDIIIAVVGGYTTILWSVLSYCIGGYQSFKFRKSVISTIYDATNNVKEPAANIDEAKSAMYRNVSEVGKFNYKYREYITTWLIFPFSRCLKNIKPCERKLKRYKTYESAGQKFTAEMDIVRILSAIRLTEFLAVLTLKKY